MSIEAPPISEEEKEVRRKLAEEIAFKNGNGNGNGHHANGSEKKTESANENNTAEENSGEKKNSGFSMFDDLKEETQQDQARKNGEQSGPGEDKKNPFENFGPENDVKEEELRSEENITLQEANARVSLYITTLDFAISLTCCGIRSDFSIGAQLKYRIHTWRKKAIQVPWVRYVMIPKKRSHPGWSLAGAIFVGTLPVLGMAYMDNLHEAKMKQDPDYSNKHKDEKNRDRNSQFDQENAKQYKKPGSPDIEDVEYVEVKDEHEDNGPETFANGKTTKKGRHAESCPKHYDKNSKEPCNCK